MFSITDVYANMRKRFRPFSLPPVNPSQEVSRNPKQVIQEVFSKSSPELCLDAMEVYQNFQVRIKKKHKIRDRTLQELLDGVRPSDG